VLDLDALGPPGRAGGEDHVGERVRGHGARRVVGGLGLQIGIVEQHDRRAGAAGARAASADCVSRIWGAASSTDPLRGAGGWAGSSGR